MIEKIENKIIISGNVVEILEYEEGYFRGYKQKHYNVDDCDDEEGKAELLKMLENYDFEINEDIKKMIEEEKEKSRIESKKRSENRARTNLRRLINHNLGKYREKDKFVTLTYAENIEDRKQTNNDFMKFIKRLRSKYEKFQYIAVIEKQERGSIHYHVVFYGLPYIPKEELQKIWGFGFVKINKIEKFNNLGRYLIKYLMKDMKNGREKSQKRYLTSRGLFKPEELYNVVDLWKYIRENNFDIKFVSQFENEYTGNGAYVYCQKK